MAPRKTPAQAVWTAVDAYFGGLLAASDEHLDAAARANQEAGLPAIDVSPLQGKFLQVMVHLTRAKRVLEIGTLGGYSTIWMARALPPGARMITLELEARHANVARANLRRAGVLDRVELRVGRALDSLAALYKAGAGPFDLIFIDADKESNPEYLGWALKLSRPGTGILVDNVARHGKIIEAESSAPDILGTRRCLEMMAAEPRLSAVALQTVGVKGLDGFALAVVLR
jgi:predicted O-methyltransferase YrrM